MDRLTPGVLRTKIEIMQGGPTDDGRGGYTDEPWTVFATPWAEVLGQDGREAVIAKVLEGVSVYRIRIRWRAGVTDAMQVRLGGVGGTDLNIQSVTDPNGDREQLMIIASSASAIKTS